MEEKKNSQEEVEPKDQNGSTADQKKDEKPADAKKLWGIVGYIFPVLFFIPLVMEELKTNSYSKFHANQQLVLLLAAVAVNIVGGVIPVLGWFIILPIGSILLIVLAVMGIINVANDRMKPLPIIGGIEIIKSSSKK